MTANTQNNPNQPPLFQSPSGTPAGQNISRLAEATSVYCRAIACMALWLLLTVIALAMTLGLGYLAIQIAFRFVKFVSVSLGL